MRMGTMLLSCLPVLSQHQSQCLAHRRRLFNIFWLINLTAWSSYRINGVNVFCGGKLTFSYNILLWQESETWRVQDTNISTSDLELASRVNSLSLSPTYQHWHDNGISLVFQICFEGKSSHLFKTALNYLEKECCVILIKNFDSSWRWSVKKMSCSNKLDV